MSEDENTEAEKAVRKVTGSEPASGEDLLGSEELKQKLREAKGREKESQNPKSK